MTGNWLHSRHQYTDRRDRELMTAYRKALAFLLDKYGKVDIWLAIDMARYTSPSRYFVNEDAAAVVIGQMDRGKDPTRYMAFTKREMYRFLYREYLRLKERFKSCNIRELVSMACSCKAPHFFMTQKSAYQTISLIKRNLKRTGNLTSNRKI